VNIFNSDFSPYVKKNVCTHYGVPYYTRMEGTRSVKLSWWWSRRRSKHVAI